MGHVDVEFVRTSGFGCLSVNGFYKSGGKEALDIL